MVNVHPVAADEHGNITDTKVLDRLRELPGLGGGGGSVGDWDETFAALDMREQTGVVIAQASDSTGDQADEYFETGWKAALTAKWPERPATLRRWVVANEAYQTTPVTWSNGDAVVSEPVIFADDFNRADSAEGALGAGWPANTAYKIAGQALTMNPSIGATVMYADTPAPGPDMSVSAVITIGNSASTGLVLRGVDANSYYGLRVNATGNILIYKVVAGTTTSLAGVDGKWTSGATLRFEVTGSTLRAYVNGALVVSGTDSTAALATATLFGVRGQSGTTPGTWDNFSANSPSQITTPASTPGVAVYNGAAAGQTAQYQRDRLASVYPVRPDVLFINHGHNYYGGAVSDFLADLQGLVDDLETLYPGAPIPVVVTSQNPRFDNGAGIQVERMKALRAYAETKGWGYIPTFEAFAARPDGGKDQIQSDGVHPLAGAGRVLMSNVAEAWIKAQSNRP